MTSEYIGVTACDECGSRFKLSERHRKLLNKPARCPKCKSMFQLTLVAPTPLEQASLDGAKADEPSQSTEPPTSKKRRRTKSEIRQESIDSICQGFRQMHSRLASISEAKKSSEEQVRIWVIDALTDVLGYDRDGEIDTEVRALGQRVDVVLKQDDHVFLVIECKNIRSKLGNKVVDQVAAYATSLSSKWAAITNGQIWKLYQVTPQKGKEPKVIEIFDIALLDEDGVSEVDAECLYLLTSKAVFGGDLEKKRHFISCTSKKRILKALASERVIKALRLELGSSYEEENEQRVNLTNDDVSGVLEDMLGLAEL
ncbi:type IV restriction endonuclease [Leptolyngbyaceae cyanobacterium CCMR0082]|uniref:Type IV restriction endonuclease n=1 Tax=Adonisia turfae CCMR0082 TaxID=2304604 RepID=A0A6M0S0R6_9CYAN|nr:type I restriction enzyme HsdR N-terminal domain-containing protein [Adonisia turfae]NEZ61986.1 type IV restriction endonuclease [Adonisia turfae CCMR0082]